MEGNEHLEAEEEDGKNHRKREDLNVSKREKTQDVLCYLLEQKQKTPNLKGETFIIYKSIPGKLPLTDESERHKEMKIFFFFQNSPALRHLLEAKKNYLRHGVTENKGQAHFLKWQCKTKLYLTLQGQTNNNKKPWH